VAGRRQSFEEPTFAVAMLQAEALGFWCGTINYISLTPLLRINTFLRFCKTNAPGTVKPHLVKAAWLEKTPLCADDLDALQQALRDVANRNERRGERCVPENKSIVYAASDASDEFGGWVLFSSTGQIISHLHCS
jgi:hypothetical protein